MVVVCQWVSCAPRWLSDDLSYYLTICLWGDRAVDSFGHTSPWWVYLLHTETLARLR